MGKRGDLPTRICLSSVAASVVVALGRSIPFSAYLQEVPGLAHRGATPPTPRHTPGVLGALSTTWKGKVTATVPLSAVPAGLSNAGLLETL